MTFQWKIRNLYISHCLIILMKNSANKNFSVYFFIYIQTFLYIDLKKKKKNPQKLSVLFHLFVSSNLFNWILLIPLWFAHKNQTSYFWFELSEEMNDCLFFKNCWINNAVYWTGDVVIFYGNVYIHTDIY